MNTLPLGIDKNLPADIYHSQPHFIGSSSIVQMDKSPKHFHQAWTQPASEPSTAQARGTLIHSLLLEQDIARYVRRPLNEKGELVRSNSKEYAAFLAENSGKVPTHPDDFDQMYAMLTSYCENSRAMAMMRDSAIEHSVFAQDPETGLLLKARPDIWGLGHLADLKSTSNIRGFERQIFTQMYDVRLAHYAKTIEYATGEALDEFFFIAYESSAPYCSKTFRMKSADMKAAKEKWRQLINQVAVCQKNGAWPGYDDSIQLVEKPQFLELEMISFEEAI